MSQVIPKHPTDVTIWDIFKRKKDKWKPVRGIRHIKNSIVIDKPGVISDTIYGVASICKDKNYTLVFLSNASNNSELDEIEREICTLLNLFPRIYNLTYRKAMRNSSFYA